MNGPGMSIFQGGESIRLNNDSEDDEDEIRDQKRRDEELNQQLQGAFDDLMDQSDTVDESTHFGSNDFNPHNNIGLNQSENVNYECDVKKLHNIIESKTREFNHVAELLSKERIAFEKQIDDYKKKLALSVAEKDRANVTRQQTHELLVESKAKISNLEDQLEKLRSKIKLTDKNNSDLVVELESTRTMLNDLQHKYRLVETNMGLKSEKNTDALMKATNDRHNAQIGMMQQQIETLTYQVEEKSNEYKRLDIRYNELQKSREALLVEKTETINQLADSLEESQRRYQKLMEKPDLTQENLRLQQKVDALEQQTCDMQATINTLTRKLEQTNSELKIMDSILGDSDLSQSLNKNSHRFTTSEDSFGKLKSELLRCISSIKEKREDIKNLELKLNEKDMIIDELKIEIGKLNSDFNVLKNNNYQLELQLKTKDTEMEQKKSYSGDERLKYEHEKTGKLLQNAYEEIDRLKNLYVEISKSKDEMTKELIESKSASRIKITALEKVLAVSEEKHSEMNQIIREKDAIIAKSPKSKPSKNTSNLCIKCLDNTTELAKCEITNLELQNTATNYLKEITDLRNQLDLHTVTINDLNKKLELKSEHDSLIVELKQKAQQFEEMFKAHENCETLSQKNASTSPIKRPQSCDRMCSTSPDLDILSQRETENRIRQEFAESFAENIKKLEKKHRIDIVKYEETLTYLKSEFGTMSTELQTKINEVEILKKVILAERNKFEEMIIEKEESNKEILEKHTTLLKRCGLEIENLQQKIQNLLAEIDEQRELFEAERNSMEARCNQLQKEKESLVEQKSELSVRVENIDADHKLALNRMREKYESARKTAKTYKTYSEDHEKHMMNEYNRLKEGYNKAVEKIELQMKDILEKRENEYSNKLKEIENKNKSSNIKNK